MGFDDDIKKAIADFASAKAQNDQANRQFDEDWEHFRSEKISPLFEQTKELFNAESSATGISAESKRENGSIILILNKDNKEAGRIWFSPSSRQITCWTFISQEPKSETFDIDKLDTNKLESKIGTFVKSFVEKHKPPKQ